MTRIEHEDIIIDLLRKALPAETVVDSLPQGMEADKAFDVRESAAWVVYDEGKPRPGNNPSSKVHVEDWVWSVIILAKAYRSPKEGAVIALAILEQVNAALSGTKIEGRALTRLGDHFYPFDKKRGLVGYVSSFSINVFAPRGA